MTKEHIRVVTGSGYIFAPKVKVSRFYTLGKEISNFYVLAHTLPPGSFVDGLLGMDFLNEVEVVIDIKNAVVLMK